MRLSWREQILKEFTPKVARLTLVADPDGLLLEEGILEGIRQRGFALIPFEDHLAFRYAYEASFRTRWDRGEQTDLVVVLHSPASDLGALPYDLLQAGRQLSFSLGDIFPNLSYPVVAALDRGDLEALFVAQRKYAPGRLGDNATKEFILRHVFAIAPELIKEPKDLLRVLLRRHYRGERIPACVDERFIQLLRQDANFQDWPLEAIVPDREAFFAFLQERWPLFLDCVADAEAMMVRERGEPFGLTYPGPAYLPFNDSDVRVYIDTLFLERLLQPVSHQQAGLLRKHWVNIGVRRDPDEDRQLRLAKLSENLRTTIPAEDARYGDWLRFARGWAEWVTLTAEGASAREERTEQTRHELQTQVDAAFAAWLTRRYAGLINLPSLPPVMLHHVPRFLARLLSEEEQRKVALVVVDGLALDQWHVLRKALTAQRPELRLRENAIFAWIPTLTSVSRQALFAGMPPVFFPDSILTTAKEEGLWIRFWMDQGLTRNQVVYAQGFDDGKLAEMAELFSHPKVRVAGLVLDKVDKIMHGMELGTAGMHNQVCQWAQQPYLGELLALLLERGFQVFLTSDHGNIEAEGCGRPTEGNTAELRGERVRIYPDPLLREKVQEKFPDALPWPPLGLPEDFLPLIATKRQAFVPKEKRIVSHGGISLEEVIVPLVQIERRAQ